MENNKNKIYTTTGDAGKTSLLGGKRVSKNDPQIETYGEVDSLNSLVGTLICTMKEAQASLNTESLVKIQNNLFSVGSYLACESQKREVFKLEPIASSAVEEVERDIDLLEKELVELKNFILPGGSIPASYSHLCRTQVRKVERLLIQNQYEDQSHGSTVAYFNRLSDYFFVLSRYINKALNIEDVIWTN